MEQQEWFFDIGYYTEFIKVRHFGKQKNERIS
jgi:hypothetical protein